MVIKFKNKLYGLHFTKDEFGYPEYSLKLNNNKNIEIFELNEYFKGNSYATEYYRLLKINKKLENDQIFHFLKDMDKNQLNFDFYPRINFNSNNNYHCMSFLLKLLNYYNIIPNFNFQNFTSDDLEYLPKLSLGLYNKPIVFKI